METSFDLLHIFLPGLVKPSLGRCTADHEGHAGTVVDEDPRRTWHAVSAAAAEVADQFTFLFLDEREDLIIQSGRLIHVGKPFFQLRHLLDAPDWKHMVKLSHESKSSSGVVDQTSGKTFHGNKSHIVFLTHVDKLQFFFGGNIAKRKL